MPGLGRRTFIATEVLTAANVNGYLMDQSVMVFAGTAARSSAIGTAVSEGMVSYLSDSDRLEVYNGSAWGAVSSSSSGNAIINGAFEINQRNFTSNTAASSFNFDRWFQDNGGTSGTLTTTPQTFTPGAAPVAGYEGSTFLQGITAAGANTNTYGLFIHRIEDVRTFAGQTATFSFWAKAASGTPKVALELIQNFGSGGSPSGANNVYAGQVTLSTSWARYSITVSVPSLSGKTIGTTANTSYLSVQLWMTAGSDFNSRTGSIGIQNNTFQFWGMQAELGSMATAFRRNAPSIQGELAACQRYYQRFTGTNENALAGVGMGAGTTAANISIPLLTSMRITPTAIDFANIRLSNKFNVAADATGAAFNGQTENSVIVNITGASGLTSLSPYFLVARASQTGFIGFSAEL